MVDPIALDIEAGNLGVDARHGPEFRIDRPKGCSDWLLLHFPTPMRIRDRHGEHRTRPDACILHSPHHPQWFRGLGAMVNHYAHLRGASLAKLVVRLDLPIDEVVYPRQVDFIAETLRAMVRERMRDDIRARMIFAAQAVQLLATFGRRLEADPIPVTPRQRSAQERVGDIRHRMRSEPWLVWSVGGMARIAGFSPSRFRALYRRFYAASPQEELILARIAHARRLLAGAPATVAAVAKACGFADPHYFSRLFHLRVGCSPSDYFRRRARKG